MPVNPRTPRTPYRRVGEPIEPEYGKDWLANLGRYAEAEQGASIAAGRVMEGDQRANNNIIARPGGDPNDDYEPTALRHMGFKRRKSQ